MRRLGEERKRINPSRLLLIASSEDPDLNRCFQAHRQSPLLSFFKSTSEVRALSSTVDWSPFLRQTVKTHFSVNGELSQRRVILRRKSRRASRCANYRYDRPTTPAREAEGTWSERAWLLAPRHIHGSLGDDSQGAFCELWGEGGVRLDPSHLS